MRLFEVLAYIDFLLAAIKRNQLEFSCIIRQKLIKFKIKTRLTGLSG